jgi:serine/threonine protein kinase/WD40 repeat protein
MSGPRDSVAADDDTVVQRFLAELEAAPSEEARDQVLRRHAAAHPARAEEFGRLAALRALLAPPRERGGPALSRLGEYHVVRRIRCGGMGEIYEAVHERLPRRVAVKIIRRGHSTPEAEARFDREQRILARLHHSHVVPLYAVGEDPARGLKYFVMPYVEGASLRDLLDVLTAGQRAHPGGPTPSLDALAQTVVRQEQQAARQTAVPAATVGTETGRRPEHDVGEEGRPEAAPPPPHARAARLSRYYFASVAAALADAGDALAHAHQVGILHRDVKPANLMVDTSGQCWVIDFGLASDREESAEAGPVPAAAVAPNADAGPLTVGLIGTLRYMAPEQYRLDPKEPPDRRTDVYGLGATLYELLALRPAFAASSYAEVREQVLARDPPSPRVSVGNVPADLVAICRKAMRKVRGERYASAAEFAVDLRRWLRGEPTAARPAWPPRRIALWARRNKGWAAALVVLFLTAALGVAAWQLRVRQVLEAETRAEVEAHVLIDRARQRLRTPTEGRRREAQALLARLAEPRRKIAPGRAADLIDLEARSAFVETLGVPDLEIEANDAQPMPGGDYACWRAALHPDGEALVLGTPRGPVRWVRGEPLRLPEGLSPADPRARLAYSPDGKYLAFAPETGGLEIWNESISRKLAQLEPAAQNPEQAILAVGFDREVRTLRACRADGQVGAWTLPDFQPAGTAKVGGRFGRLTAAAFNADATRLAVGDAKGVVLLCQATGRLERELPAPRPRVDALAWSPDDRLAAVGSQDGIVQLWRTADGAPVYSLVGAATGVSSLLFDPAGRWLLAGGREFQMRMWDVVTGEQLLDGGYAPMGLARDGRLAVSDWVHVGFARLVLPETVRHLSGHRAILQSNYWCPGSRYLVTLDHACDIRLWDVRRGVELDRFSHPLGPEYASNVKAAASEDARLVASAGATDVFLHDRMTGQQWHWTFPVSAYGNLLASVGEGKFLLLREERDRWQSVAYEVRAGDAPPRRVRVGRPPVANERGMLGAGLTTDGRYYVWVGPRAPQENRRVEVYDLTTGRLRAGVPVPTPPGERQEPGATLSADGHWLTTSTADKQFLHDLTGGAPPEPLPFALGWFSPDGRWLVTRYGEPEEFADALTLRSWATRRAWLVLLSDWNHFQGHGFSPDGRYLALSTQPGRLTLLDLAAAEAEVKRFEETLHRK